jgi:hypothetical protein
MIQITGRSNEDVTLRFDQDEVYAMLDLLDLVDTKDIVRNPDNYSLDADSASAVQKIANDLKRALGRR